MSTIPEKLKLESNQTITEIEKIIVPAFFKILYPYPKYEALNF